MWHQEHKGMLRYFSLTLLEKFIKFSNSCSVAHSPNYSTPQGRRHGGVFEDSPGFRDVRGQLFQHQEQERIRAVVGSGCPGSQYLRQKGQVGHDLKMFISFSYKVEAILMAWP